MALQLSLYLPHNKVIEMKCTLNNNCQRKDWCCNFCIIGCDARCTKCHKDCEMFVVEEDDKKEK